jgi:DNA-binding MarR family transcriptional regulator
MWSLVMSQRHRFLDIASESELHPAQVGALLQMSPDQPLPMTELASRLHCDNSNVTGLVDRLEARGLVARRPHERDRRVKQLVLTEAGALLRDSVRARLAGAPEELRALPVARQRALRDALRAAAAPGASARSGRAA